MKKIIYFFILTLLISCTNISEYRVEKENLIKDTEITEFINKLEQAYNTKNPLYFCAMHTNDYKRGLKQLKISIDKIFAKYKLLNIQMRIDDFHISRNKVFVKIFFKRQSVRESDDVIEKRRGHTTLILEKKVILKVFNYSGENPWYD